jgi:hypothetical protein
MNDLISARVIAPFNDPLKKVVAKIAVRGCRVIGIVRSIEIHGGDHPTLSVELHPACSLVPHVRPTSAPNDTNSLEGVVSRVNGEFTVSLSLALAPKGYAVSEGHLSVNFEHGTVTLPLGSAPHRLTAMVSEGDLSVSYRADEVFAGETILAQRADHH